MGHPPVHGQLEPAQADLRDAQAQTRRLERQHLVVRSKQPRSDERVRARHLRPLLVHGRGDDDVAARRRVRTRERVEQPDRDREPGLHVGRAAAVDAAVARLAAERIDRPAAPDGHRVHVREQDEPRPFARAVNGCHEVGAAVGDCDLVDPHADAFETLAYPAGTCGLERAGVLAVDPDELDRVLERPRDVDRSHPTSCPASTRTASPVMPRASDDASQTAVSATSSGVTSRLAPPACANRSIVSSTLAPSRSATSRATARSSGLSTLPGQIALTRIPEPESSAAKLSTSPRRPNLDAQYAEAPASPRRPAVEERKAKLPSPPRASIRRTKAAAA